MCVIGDELESAVRGPCVIDLVSKSGDITVTPQSTPRSVEVSGPISLVTPESGSSFDLTGEQIWFQFISWLEICDCCCLQFE